MKHLSHKNSWRCQGMLLQNNLLCWTNSYDSWFSFKRCLFVYLFSCVTKILIWRGHPKQVWKGRPSRVTALFIFTFVFFVSMMLLKEASQKQKLSNNALYWNPFFLNKNVLYSWRVWLYPRHFLFGEIFESFDLCHHLWSLGCARLTRIGMIRRATTARNCSLLSLIVVRKEAVMVKWAIFCSMTAY